MTLPLWRVLELTDDTGTGANIGLDSYPIWDETERLGLNQLIIDHFWNRDIGQETIGMFTFMLRRTMREIMPTYNQLYSTQHLLVGKELATYDLTTVRSGTVKDTSTSASESDTSSEAQATSESVFFDTPQTALSRNKDYAANATAGQSDTTNSGKSTGTSTGETDTASADTSRTTGTQGSLADMLTRYRGTILNIDFMLLNDTELTTMFLGVWDTGEPIQPPRPFMLRSF